MKEPGPEHRAYTRTAIVTRLRDADNFSYFDACRGADALEELVAENDALRAKLEAALELADDLLEDLELNGLHDDPAFHYRTQKAQYKAIAS